MPAISSISIVIGAITTGFSAALKVASGIATAFVSVLTSLGSALMSLATSIIGSVISAITGLITSIVKLTSVAAAFTTGALVAIATKSVTAAAGLETLQVQFESLLGSATKAAKRMDELKEFSKKTPFQLKDIAQASRVLQALTKGALATGDGLRMVGDAAAQAGQPIQEIAVHIGRLFQGAQTGRAVGEALARLQELGMISGDTRTKFEMLQKAGLKGADVWGVVAKELNLTDGAMDKLSKTTSGLWSTLKDNLSIAFAELGKILTPLVNRVVKRAITFFAKLGDVIKNNADNIKKFAIDAVLKYGPPVISLARTIGSVFVKAFNMVASALSNTTKKVAGFKGDTKDAFAAISKGILSAVVAIQFTLENFGDVMSNVAIRVKLIWSKSMRDILRSFRDVFKMYADIKSRLDPDVTKFTIEKFAKEMEDYEKRIVAAQTQVSKLNKELKISNKELGEKFIKSSDEIKKRWKDIAKDIEKAFKSMAKPGGEQVGMFERMRRTVEALVKGAKDFGKFANMGAEDLENKLKAMKKAAKEIGQPTLALRGSQEAARGEAGLLGQDKMIKLNEKQVKLLEQIRDKNNAMANPVANFGFVGGM